MGSLWAAPTLWRRAMRPPASGSDVSPAWPSEKGLGLLFRALLGSPGVCTQWGQAKQGSARVCPTLGDRRGGAPSVWDIGWRRDGTRGFCFLVFLTVLQLP